MPSEIDILNGALGLAGMRRISSIDDGTENANHCRVFYPLILDASLRMHHWNFATGRKTLGQLVDVPTFEFLYAYQVPADFIKLREYYDDQITLTIDNNDFQYIKYYSKFRLEILEQNDDLATQKKVIVSNGTVVNLVYTRRATNPDLWDGMFARGLMHLLASDLANAGPRDSKKAELMTTLGDGYMSMAMGVDGQEQSNEAFIVDDLTWGR